MLNKKYSHLTAFVAITTLALAAHYLGAPTEIMGPLYLALSAAVVQLAKQSEPHPRKPPSDPPKRITLTTTGIVLLALTACTPAARHGIPVLSTIDAIGMGVSQVMGWCEDAGADATTLARARHAYSDKDYREALSLLTDISERLRKQGADIPDEAFVTLKLAQGALAAEAIQDGMRALSGTAKP